jgi:CIC family chloride channel protein
VELLLFEWKPRSFVPVALACASAMAMRQFLMEPGPLFPVALHGAVTGLKPLGGAVLAGIGAGLLSAAMTYSVYFFEDGFLEYGKKLHWMWWPAIAGLVIGIGGLICPRALGVGYDVIGDLLNDRMSPTETLVLVAVKWGIWAFALGSGTSGGVLAPLLMLGAGLGSLEARVLPDCGPGFWPLIGMGAILGGTMRAPFTGILFAMEITHDWNLLLPLAVAVTVAHAFTVLVLRRSILTEKVARRGYHLSREYAIDPLEVLFVREVMRPPVGKLPEGPVAYTDETLKMITYRMAEQRVYQLLVVDREDGSHQGIVALEDVLAARRRHLEEETRRERPLRLTMLLAPFRRAS